MSAKIDRIVIIGGSTAAYEAACHSRNLLPGTEITVIEENEIFAYYTDGMCYYLSGDIESFQTLQSTIYGVQKDREYFKKVYDFDVIPNHKPLKIDRKGKILLCRNLKFGKEIELPYDKLLIAPNRSPRRPDIKGVNLPGVGFFASPQDAINLRKELERGQLEKVAVIGATPVGCCLCESFGDLWGVEPVLFCQSQHILEETIDPDFEPVLHNELHRYNIDHYLGIRFEEICPENDKLAIVLADGKKYTGFDRIILAAVNQPSASLAIDAGLKIGEKGGIMVDNFLRTEDPNILAAGPSTEVADILTGKTKLIPTGLVESNVGKVAAVNLTGGSEEIPPLVSSSLMKIFKMNLGTVGLTEKAAKSAGIKFEAVRGLFSDRAFYYPEVELISAKLVFDPDNGKILGLQVAGKGYMVRNLDAASAFIKKGGTIQDLKEFEPAFTPPLTDMEYPLHSLAVYAEGLMKGAVKPMNPLDYQSGVKNWIVVDVREDYEFEDKPPTVECRELINLPYTQLRLRMSELPEDEPLLMVCSRGARSSAAANMLKKAGYKTVSFLSGGLSFFQ